ncbi:MAG: phosphate signaling complex protein PhoU [Cyclobacteriaceae bacterium]|nr:phosphate signaling complex protein PhoU [Cyclobacteriaceae bacterium]
MNSTLDPELQALRDNLLEMVDLIEEQLERSKKSLVKVDRDIAKSILEGEKRVNDMELIIGKDCENILALHHPVATDLRFVIATMKMSYDLERTGDNIKIFAKFLHANLHKNNLSLIERFKFDSFIDLFIEWLHEVKKSIKSDNPDLVKKIIKSSQIMEKRKSATKLAAELIKENPDKVKVILRLYALVQRMARIGSMITNICEEIVFYREAKVLKHHAKK